MRHLSEGLLSTDQFRSSWKVPSKVAILGAHLRLGLEPVKKLYEAVASPLATPGDVGAFYSWITPCCN